MPDQDEELELDADGNPIEAKAKPGEGEGLAKVLAEFRESNAKQSNDSLALAKILGDPDVQALLAAKQKGAKVKVTEGEEPTAAQLPDDVDVETMTNKELVKFLLGNVSKTIAEATSKATQPLDQRTKTFEAFVVQQMQDTAAKAVKSAKEKFQDFEQYRKAMHKASLDNPGLDVDELYLIAKKRAGALDETPPRIQSERPSAAPGKPARRAPKTNPHGSSGWNNSIAQALESLNFDDLAK
jgi:hypothetical protein